MDHQSIAGEAMRALTQLAQLAATLIGRPVYIHVLSEAEEAIVRQAEGLPMPGQEPLFSQADGWPWL